MSLSLLAVISRLLLKAEWLRDTTEHWYQNEWTLMFSLMWIRINQNRLLSNQRVHVHCCRIPLPKHLPEDSLWRTFLFVDGLGTPPSIRLLQEGSGTDDWLNTPRHETRRLLFRSFFLVGARRKNFLTRLQLLPASRHTHQLLKQLGVCHPCLITRRCCWCTTVAGEKRVHQHNATLTG